MGQKYETSIEQFLSEKLNLSFCKYVLGVHKKSQNSAVRGELGRFPIGVNIDANILLYYHNLQCTTTNSLLKEALAVNEIAPKSWASKCVQLKRYINVNSNSNIVYSERKSIEQFIKSSYEKIWLDKINSETKMRTYKLFKQNLAYEPYLNIINAEHRKSFTRFRISAHSLAIERGRYTKPPTPIDPRTCRYCPQKIESEHHFLLECKTFSEDRKLLLEFITEQCIHFNILNNCQKFIYIYTIVQIIAKFIHCHLP